MGLFSFFGGIPLPIASESAQRFDDFYSFLLIYGIVSFVGVIGAGFIFVLKYRRKREGETTPYIPHNFTVEFGSIFATSVIVAVIFLWGYSAYRANISPKMGEYEINVIGQQWNWQVQYANGKTYMNEMYVPVGKPVKLIMTSKDVLHSFFVPAFRVKQDLVPGIYTTLRFTPTKEGTYDIFCAEYCGTAHSGMLGKIHVVSQPDFKSFLAGLYKNEIPSSLAAGGKNAVAKDGGASMAQKGEQLFKSKTCITCHSVDGSRVVGPSMKNLFGKMEELADGSKVLVDESYILESMNDPMKKVVKSYPPAMPTFRGLVSDEEMNNIIAYIKSLK